MKYRYLVVAQFNDGENVTSTFESFDEMQVWLDEMSQYIEKVALKMKFSAEKGSNDVELFI